MNASGFLSRLTPKTVIGGWFFVKSHTVFFHKAKFNNGVTLIEVQLFFLNLCIGIAVSRYFFSTSDLKFQMLGLLLGSLALPAIVFVPFYLKKLLYKGDIWMPDCKCGAHDFQIELEEPPFYIVCLTCGLKYRKDKNRVFVLDENLNETLFKTFIFFKGWVEKVLFSFAVRPGYESKNLIIELNGGSDSTKMISAMMRAFSPLKARIRKNAEPSTDAKTLYHMDSQIGEFFIASSANDSILIFAEENQRAIAKIETVLVQSGDFRKVPFADAEDEGKL